MWRLDIGKEGGGGPLLTLSGVRVSSLAQKKMALGSERSVRGIVEPQSLETCVRANRFATQCPVDGRARASERVLSVPSCVYTYQVCIYFEKTGMRGLKQIGAMIIARDRGFEERDRDFGAVVLHGVLVHPDMCFRYVSLCFVGVHFRFYDFQATASCAENECK